MIRVRLGSWALCVALCAGPIGCGDDEGDDGSVMTGKKDAGPDAGLDAGRPMTDAQVARDAGHDTGPGDDAGVVPCEEAACAASAGECQVGTCNEATRQCVLTDKADDTLCGSGTDDECTRPDRCMAGSCVSNDVAQGSPCGDQGVDCHVNDSCDGNGQCADGGFAALNSTCGSATNTACDNPDSCDAAGQCLPNYEASTTVCGDVGVDCHNPDTCNGAGACDDGGLWLPVGNSIETCGPAGGEIIDGELRCYCGSNQVGVCTEADYCDDTGQCLPKNKNEGGSCGAPGVCETARTCQSGSCVGTPKTNGTGCGAADNDCQMNKQCNAGSCEPVLKVDGASCGSPTNSPPCNGADTCLAGVCQTHLAADGASCGDATNTRECDGADSCLAGVCNPNHYGAIECGSPPTDCQLPNLCNAGSCQPDPMQYEPAGAACGSHLFTGCSQPDTCNGSGFCNPNHASAGLPCGPAGNACAPQDSCNASGVCVDAGTTPCTQTVTGTVRAREDSSPIAGVTVTAPGSGATPAVTDAQGNFSLQLPLNVEVMVVAQPIAGRWGEAFGRLLDLGNLNLGNIYLWSDAGYETFLSNLPGNPTPNLATGQVQVPFHNVSFAGGESVDLSASYDGVYTTDSGTWVMSNTLGPDDEYVYFVNVAVGAGTTMVAPMGNAGNDCALARPVANWPVVAHVVTTVVVACQ